METFRGSGHLPGAPKVWDVELDADWQKKEFTVHIPAARAKLTDWPGLMVQTIGDAEAVFRTRGIPPLQIHWWHVVRNTAGGLWAMVLVPLAKREYGSAVAFAWTRRWDDLPHYLWLVYIKEYLTDCQF